jgi:5-methylcytosine-specific restriction endonuclease McrA
MKRTPINKISKKRKVEMGIEAELRAKLLEEHGNQCMECGGQPTEVPFRLEKHEIVFRSHGGSPIDPDNCIMLCPKCHRRRHNR